MTFSEEELMAYADGELEGARRQEIQDAIKRDPEIAGRVEAHRALRSSLRASFDPVLQEPVPDRLLATARARPHEPEADTHSTAPEPRADGRSSPRATQPNSKSNVVPLRGHRVPARSRPQWLALAASFILGALALQLGLRWLNTPIYTAQGLILPELQPALSNQLANTQSTQAPVKIGVSFLSKSGEYCRTFQVQSLAGLACNDAGSWKVQVLVRTSGANTEYRQAGSNMPSAVMQAVTESIAGEPLDAKAEAHARAEKWQRRK